MAQYDESNMNFFSGTPETADSSDQNKKNLEANDENVHVEPDPEQNQNNEAINDMAKNEQKAITQEDVNVAQEFLLDKSKVLNDLISKIEGVLELNEDVAGLDSDYAKNAIINKLFDEFQEIYVGCRDKIHVVEQGIRAFPDEPRIEEFIGTIREIESLRFRKDEAVILASEFKDLLRSNSNENIVENIDNLQESGDLSSEEANNLKVRLNQIQDFAGMTLDKFIEYNKGSSLETFLAFLVDPVGTTGKKSLEFQTTNVEGFGEAEIVPVSLFRDLFADNKKVSSVLKKAMEKVDESWASNNSTALLEIESGRDPQKTKDMLIKIFNELLNNNEKKDEYVRKFRIHFATQLVENNENKLRYMDKSSFLFLIDNLKDGGSNLDSLWEL